MAGIRIHALVAFMVVAFSLTACSRPSFDEVSKELARLVDPAARAALNGADPSERNVGTDHCGDPFTGPKNGIQPTLSYRVSTAELGSEPNDFVRRAEKVWIDEGLEVENGDSENVFGRFASSPGYGLEAFVNHTNQEAVIRGTGPCVEDPDAGLK